MFWKVFFWIFTVIIALYHASVGFPRIWEFVDLVFSIIAVVGLFGLSWERKIFTRLFWRIFLIVCISWGIFYSYLLPDIPINYTVPVSEEFLFIDSVLTWVLTILVFVAIFLYGFKRNYLWE